MKYILIFLLLFTFGCNKEPNVEVSLNKNCFIKKQSDDQYTFYQKIVINNDLIGLRKINCPALNYYLTDNYESIRLRTLRECKDVYVGLYINTDLTTDFINIDCPRWEND